MAISNINVENKYVSNPFANNWLTIQIKLEKKDKNSEVIDFDEFNIVIDEM